MGSSVLVRKFCWHVAVADVELLVEMGQLAACILEEEFPVQCKGRRENIGKQETTVGEERRRIRSPDDDFERDETLEFAHEGEADGKHDGNGDEKGVRKHCRGSLEISLGSALV